MIQDPVSLGLHFANILKTCFCFVLLHTTAKSTVISENPMKGWRHGILSTELRLFLLFFQIGTAVPSGEKDCKHGTYVSETESCTCDPHWKTAGITDTLDFLEGVCEQYQCVDDQTCKESLRGYVDDFDVSCPVPKWNCYCGWKYAFMAGGHGFETPRYQNGTNSTGAECMGLMYAFSVWSYFSLKWMIKWVLCMTLVSCVVLLCFGKKRIRCDHHEASLWNEFRKCCGHPPVCNGGCHVQLEEWTVDVIRDNFAWSLYALSVGTWILTFLIVLFGLAMFAWSIVLWAMVFLLLIVSAVVGLCMCCGEGAAAIGHCDCNFDCDCCGCDPGAGLVEDGSLSELMYWGGPHPEICMGWDCSSCIGVGPPDTCSCCSCTGCCYPIAWLILRFPRMPDNMWGGLFGWFIGTHSFTPAERAYTGGSAFIDFLGMHWMRVGDLHSHTDWRAQVFDFLYSTHASELPYNDVGVSAETSSLRIGHATVQHIHRTFGDGDRCVPSSFEDYKNNKCWICQQEDETDWDLWLTCKHMYCQHCSEKMLRRRMPCPLCRVSSTAVWRGHASKAPR